MSSIHFTTDDVITIARSIRSDHGENPEYDRALVDMTHDLIAGVTGQGTEGLTQLILGDRDSFTDPPHVRDTTKSCAWCGVDWRRSHNPTRYSTSQVTETLRLGALEMRHRDGCIYIEWQDEQGRRADA
jgi:hypothetical protein